MTTPFRDRSDAGRRLADCVLPLRLASPLVLALPRGGVPVAAQVAAALDAPLDVFVAAKIGAPGHEELGIGALAEGLDAPVVSDTARRLGVSPADLGRLAGPVRSELARRVAAYRGGRSLPEMTGRDVVLVDDGLATGVTAQAALMALRARHPHRLVLAVPVCAQRSAERLGDIAERVVCVESSADFLAVSQWYEDFGQVSDDEVIDLLGRRADSPLPGRSPQAPPKS